MYQDYGIKDPGYFENVRKELLDLIPDDLKQKTILEVGAASGATLCYAKKNGLASKVIGYDLCKMENSLQCSELMDKFVIGDIENMDFDEGDKSVDVIICGDVLEHLKEPGVVLLKMQRILKDDGVIISSIPNIRNKNVLKQIIFKGDFRYADWGILDRTHLRFFCKKNILELFEDNGYKVEKTVMNPPIKIRINILRTLKRMIFRNFYAIQYYTVARKS